MPATDVSVDRLDELVDEALELAADRLRDGDRRAACDYLAHAVALHQYRRDREAETLACLERAPRTARRRRRARRYRRECAVDVRDP
jgi:hypothetical protein